MKRFVSSLFLLFFLSSCEKDVTKFVSNKEVKKQICVVPLDNVDTKDVEISVKELKDFYKCNVVILNRDFLPDSLKVKGSNKYNSQKILSFLTKKYGKLDGKILGLTSKDISVDERILNGVKYKNWSVLGLGSLGGKRCVVSTYRLSYNKKDRLSKVVIHEIGHNLGLNHCEKDSHCLMNDAKGTASTIDKEKKIMCSFCVKKMKW